jgi:hypothetical protein
MHSLAIPLAERLGPRATDLVRRDHAALLADFHHYRRGAPPRLRRALAYRLCVAIEVHAQIEEELLYPALREVVRLDFLGQARAAHERMRALIARIRQISPQDPAFDAAVFELMREVLHHVAEEETAFLPTAERVLQGRLRELGLLMLRRRVALLAPRLPRWAYERARGLRGPTLALVGLGLLAWGLRAGTRRPAP